MAADRAPAAQVTAVVLNAEAHPGLAEHLQVEIGALPQTGGLEHLAALVQLGRVFRQLVLDGLQSLIEALGRGDVEPRRVDGDGLNVLENLARQRLDLGDALELLVEELAAQHEVVIGRVDLHHVAAHAKSSALKSGVVALVLHGDEPAKQPLPVIRLAGRDRQAHLAVVLR